MIISSILTILGAACFLTPVITGAPGGIVFAGLLMGFIGMGSGYYLAEMAIKAKERK